MGAAWRIVPAALTVVTLGIVLWQQQMIGDLRERVDEIAHDTGEETRAAETERLPFTPAEVEQPPTPEPTPEPEPALAEEETRRLQARVQSLEGQVSLAMTLLQGLTFRPGDELLAEEGDEAALAEAEEEAEEEEELLYEEIARLRADVDRLLDRDELTAEERQRLEALMARAERAPARRFYDRWTRLEEDLDGVWVDNFSKIAGLDQDQQAAVQDLVERRRSVQREALQDLRTGERSPVDVQVELTELDQELRRELRGVLDADQLERFRRNLQERESVWIGYQ